MAAAELSKSQQENGANGKYEKARAVTRLTYFGKWSLQITIEIPSAANRALPAVFLMLVSCFAYSSTLNVPPKRRCISTKYTALCRRREKPS
jgi:hypothetical protein